MPSSELSTLQNGYDRVDVVVITALSPEFDAVLAVNEGAWAGSAWECHKNPFSGLPISFRTFSSTNGEPLRVAVAHSGGMGMVHTAATLAVLCDRLAPQCIAMCGVCAGRREKTSLGDVIAGERLDIFDSGKELPGGKIQADPNPYVLRHDWKVALERLCPVERFRESTWLRTRPIPLKWQENWVLWQVHSNSWSSISETLTTSCPQWDKVSATLVKEHLQRYANGANSSCPFDLTTKGQRRVERLSAQYHGKFPDLSPSENVLPFKFHVAPIVTGNRVCEDENVWGFITDHMRKTLGLEMEAAAIGHVAALALSKPDALVVKGVMDFANHGRDDHFKVFAARASAECLISFLRERISPRSMVPPSDHLQKPGPVTALEELNQWAIIEMFYTLTKAWGVDEAKFRMAGVVRCLSVLRSTTELPELQKASRKLRPYLGNSVRHLLPKTAEFIDVCKKGLPEVLRAQLDLF